MRPPTRRALEHLDPNSMLPVTGSFSINTRPAVPAPPPGGPEQWGRWSDWADVHAAHVNGTATKNGVRVRSDVPMGKMDPGYKEQNVDRLFLHLSARGQRAYVEMPRWRRWVIAVLLWLGAVAGRLARRVEGAGAGKKKTADGGTELVRLERGKQVPAGVRIESGVKR